MMTVEELAKQSREAYDKSGTFDTKWNNALQYDTEVNIHVALLITF